MVYPAFEKYLGETGIALANKDRNDHSLVTTKAGSLACDKPVLIISIAQGGAKEISGYASNRCWFLPHAG